jgi:predicted ester cyclase
MKTKAFLGIAGMCCIVLLFSCNPKPAEPQEDPIAKQEATNKANYRAITEAFNTFNSAALDTLIAADGIDHDGESTYVGAEMAKQVLDAFKTGFPDGKTEILSIVAEGDMVMAYTSFTGTNTGEFFGMAATNKPVKYTAVDIVQYKDGKAFEHWYVSDNYGMMMQMGAIPPPPPAEK